MIRKKQNFRSKISKLFKKHGAKQTWLTPTLFVLVIILSLLVGYIGGKNHYSIEATFGPLFGYNSHSGSINLSSLEKTYNYLAANYDGTIDKEKLIEGANQGMVEAVGDYYTTYFNASESTEFNNNLTGNIGGGIGAEIGLRNNKVTVVRVLNDNPAKAAGVLGGDIITKINDDTTEGWTVERAVSKIRGEVGTTVKITVLRGTETKEFNITRDTINNPSVESSIENGVGTITISRFDEATGSLARAAAENFKTQNVKGVILDLRDNGGGYVEAAKQVASIWLDNKIIVTERRGTVTTDTIRSGSNPILNGIPTVVLVNGNSASASEIVAGALQDHKVAKIVGQKTFGKGSVQKLVDLDGGAQLKVTIAKWYTPNGKNISKTGIEPDVKATLTQDDVNNNLDPQMNAAIKALGL